MFESYGLGAENCADAADATECKCRPSVMDVEHS